MEFDVTGKFDGLCRCCSLEGNHRDLNKEYSWCGIREVYADIFHECFNLSLSSHAGLSTLICSECIKRLRDASNFKILVVDTEKQLLKTVRTNLGRENDLNTGTVGKVIGGVKLEHEPNVKVDSWPIGHDSLKDDLYTEEDTDSYKSDAFQDVSTPCSEGEDVVDGEQELLKRFSAKTVKPLPTRATLNNICKVFAKHLDLLKGKNITGKSLETLLLPKNTGEKDISSKNERPDNTGQNKRRTQRIQYKNKLKDIDKEKNPRAVERLSHAANITAILEHSNVTAFKAKHQRAYPCFYCESLFEEFDDLRKHQTDNHSRENISQTVLSKYRVGKPDGLVVYVDVTGLKCTLCDSNIPNLKELKTHLTKMHQKKMYLEFSDRVIPFKVRENNFECQVCETLYETFGSVERHMNMHYRNYVCEECGSGFVTKQRLRIHGYLMHSKKPGKFPCDVCQKQFATQQKRKLHIETVHENIKKYKCNRCDERFNEYFRRHKHMVTAHGVAPIQYKCNICEKTFDRRYALSVHMRTHIQQKDVYCDLCPYRCFTKVELRQHMVRHNGARIFECSVCHKSFARAKTLKEHARSHGGGRVRVCPLCGAAFLHNCSLKAHVNRHHKEYGRV